MKHLFFRRMLTEPEVFLKPLGVSRPRLCDWTYLKSLVGRSSNIASPATSHFNRPCLGLHGSGWVCPDWSGSWSRCTFTGILEPQGAVPQALTLLGVVGFIAWHPSADKAWGIFGATGRVWATVLRSVTPNKAPCHTHSFGGTVDKYRLVRWVLWYINICRLLNAKSILMQVVTFSNNSA